MYQALVLFHIILAATVWGVPLGSVSSAKRARGVSKEAFHQAAKEGERKGKIASIAAVLTLLTGLGLMALYPGGFKAISKNFHHAATLMIIAIIFAFAWMKPNGSKLVSASDPASPDDAAADSALKKLAAGSGILQLLWTLILALMIFRF